MMRGLHGEGTLRVKLRKLGDYMVRKSYIQVKDRVKRLCSGILNLGRTIR